MSKNKKILNPASSKMKLFEVKLLNFVVGSFIKNEVYGRNPITSKKELFITNVQQHVQ